MKVSFKFKHFKSVGTKIFEIFEAMFQFQKIQIIEKSDKVQSSLTWTTTSSDTP